MCVLGGGGVPHSLYLDLGLRFHSVCVCVCGLIHYLSSLCMLCFMCVLSNVCMTDNRNLLVSCCTILVV